ncbi:hypothetical protein AB0H83_03130, partial [Dactylosporangium sp. NPDC050688]|uniref:hypothetical protein n=1 Tax=Dactylosporangium sp. NPDC050688 TaxID=3157217 RepID=UPI0033ED10C0
GATLDRRDAGQARRWTGATLDRRDAGQARRWTPRNSSHGWLGRAVSAKASHTGPVMPAKLAAPQAWQASRA